MTAALVSIERQETSPQYRAIAGKHQSIGRTPGEALDALNAQLSEGDKAALIVVQQVQPDLYFSEAQYLRSQELLARRETLTEEEQKELEALAREELLASGRRTQAIADALKK